MNAKKALTGSLLTLAATGFAVSPAAAYGGGDHKSDDPSFSQKIQVIDDVCVLNRVVTLGILGRADSSSTQCNDAKHHSAVVGNN
ncbi:hypothetical protein [Streptomyces sp. Wb2n-11]|uniref:hypothetical protein n=1 Tax=Streptomyces sp. Wb2n-11 TaxID=1030533 RepID=UPI000A923D93|nr:hypothetical protein [Streptomyces sp. Wb2n-11]